MSGGTRWPSWLRHCATSRKVLGSIPDGVIGVFHWHNPSGRTMAPRVDSASNRNEYQEYFLGGKGGRCIDWQSYRLHVLSVLKSGSLILPEPSGSVQACNGIALSLPSSCSKIQKTRDRLWIVIFTLLYRSFIVNLVGTTDKETPVNVGITSAKSQKVSVWMHTLWDYAVKQINFFSLSLNLLPLHYGPIVEDYCFTLSGTHAYTR